MLYISRHLDNGKHGVIDTSDEVETIVSTRELKHIVCKLGIQIAGVVVGESDKGREVLSVYTAEPEIDVKAQLGKLAVLCGINIKLSAGGGIACIVLSDVSLTKPIRVRLSNFGVGCRDPLIMLRAGVPNGSGKNITFVLDDRFSIDTSTFRLASTYRFTLDITEVSRLYTRELIYRYADIDWEAKDGVYFPFIKDQPKYQSLFCASRIIGGSLVSAEERELLVDLVKDDYIRKTILHLHLSESTTILTYGFAADYKEARDKKYIDCAQVVYYSDTSDFYGADRCTTFIEQHYQPNKHSVHLWAGSRLFREILGSDFFIDSHIVLEYARLQALVEYCNPPASITKRFYKMVNRVAELVYERYTGLYGRVKTE